MGGASLVKESVTHIIIYSYLAQQNHNPGKARGCWGPVDGKPYYTSLVKGLGRFIAAANMLGCGIQKHQEEGSAIRHLMFRLVQALCEAEVLSREDYKLFDAVAGKPQTAFKLWLNILITQNCRVPSANIAACPPKASLVGGEAYYLNKHFMLISKIVKPNKRSYGRSHCLSVDAFNALSSIRYRVDQGLLTTVLRVAADHYGVDRGLLSIDSIGSRIHELEEIVLRGDSGQKKRGGEELAYLRQIHDLLVFASEASSSAGGFYFYYFADFRGRVYVNSPLSPTTNKLIRFCLKFDDYSEDEVSSHKLVGDYALAYEGHSHIFKRRGLSDFQKHVAACVLIEVGKLFKSEAGGCADLRKLADLGSLHWEGEGLKGLDDKVEFAYYKYALDYALSYDNCPFPFYFDATASGLQILGLLLKPINDEVAQNLNLTSTTHWYDTYSFIIAMFLQNESLDPSVSPYFTRSYLKSSIMVSNYGGTYFSSYKRFKEQVGSLAGQDKMLLIESAYKRFYSFVDSVFEGEAFFRVSSRVLIRAIIQASGNTFTK